ncbi:hypothetical protein [Phormidesmis priestleyi]
MTQLTAQILSLHEDEKVRLIHALSEQMVSPHPGRGLRYYSLDSILELEPDIWSPSKPPNFSTI